MANNVSLPAPAATTLVITDTLKEKQWEGATAAWCEQQQQLLLLLQAPAPPEE